MNYTTNTEHVKYKDKWGYVYTIKAIPEGKRRCTECLVIRNISEFENYKRCKICRVADCKKKSRKVTCTCGKMISKGYLKKHLRTKLHLNFFYSNIRNP